MSLIYQVISINSQNQDLKMKLLNIKCICLVSSFNNDKYWTVEWLLRGQYK